MTRRPKINLKKWVKRMKYSAILKNASFTTKPVKTGKNISGHRMPAAAVAASTGRSMHSKGKAADLAGSSNHTA